MPIIKSAVKRMRQTAKSRARNQVTKRSLRTEIKSLNALVEAKSGAKAAEQLKVVQSRLDIAVKKNVLKKNTAARKMAQLTRSVKNLGAKPSPAKPSTKTKKAAPKKTATSATKKAVTKKTTAKK